MVQQPTDEQKANYREWVSTRPEPVKTTATRLLPWVVYRHVKTDQLCVVQSFNEDGTVTMAIVGHVDPIRDLLENGMPYGVLGVSPDDLVEHEGVNQLETKW